MNPILRTPLSLPALLLCGTFAAVPAWAAPTTDPGELAEGGMYRELVVVETIAAPAPAMPAAPEAATTPAATMTVTPSATPMAPMTPVVPAVPPSATNPTTPK